MSQPIFPPEILNHTAESYYNRLTIQSRIIYLSALAFVALIIILFPVIYIDVTSQNRGVIRTPHENTVIQSAVYAEIMQCNLSENKVVQAGDTLLVLNTDRLDEQILLENQKLEQNRQFISDLSVLLNGNAEFHTSQYQSEYNRYHSKVREQEVLIGYLEKEYDTSRKLYEKQVVSELDYLQQKNNWEKAETQLSYLKEEYRSSWQGERTRLEMESRTIESTINQLEEEKRQYVLTAPASGALVQVAGFQSGNFIAPNQSLAFISQPDSLLVECYVHPKDIGYIRTGQSVVFQVDAFNYREWGMIEGRVVEILNDVVTIENQSVFRVRCSLDSSCLQLKNGYEGCLKKGMTLTGRFHLSRRSLWQLLFDKVDDWMNPKIMKKETIF